MCTCGGPPSRADVAKIVAGKANDSSGSRRRGPRGGVWTDQLGPKGERGATRCKEVCTLERFSSRDWCFEEATGERVLDASR